MRLDLVWRKYMMVQLGLLAPVVLMSLRTSCIEINKDCNDPANRALSTQVAKTHSRLAEIDGALLKQNVLFQEQMHNLLAT